MRYGLALIALFVATNVSAAEARRDFRSDDRKVINSWLAAHPGYRLANSKDCSDPDCNSLREMDGYFGYFLANDLNGDGHEDIAVTFIDQKRKPEKHFGGNFTVVVFNGPFPNSKESKPAFISEGNDLSYGGFFFGLSHHKPPFRLLFGTAESEGSLLIPKGNTYEVDEEDGE